MDWYQVGRICAIEAFEKKSIVQGGSGWEPRRLAGEIFILAASISHKRKKPKIKKKKNPPLILSFAKLWICT